MPFAPSESLTSIDSVDAALQPTASQSEPYGAATLPTTSQFTGRADAQQVVFVDSALDNVEALIGSLSSTAVYLIEADQDGASVVSDTLAQYTREQVESVHIFAHGQAGSIQIGGITLSADNVTGYSEDLAAWSESITGDVLLYGCNVGEGAVGQAFVQRLSDLTGADIQASDDLTGTQSLGGDWDLEVSVGEIDAEIAITAAGQASYQGTLRTITSNGGGPTAVIYVDEGTTAITDVDSTSDTNSDTEGNGIIYYIEKGNDKRFLDIDNDTGVITFRNAPNFEAPEDADENNVYLANVIAIDSEGDSDSQFLSIIVRDVDEGGSAPVITGIGSRFPDYKRVDEGSKFVANIETFDADGDTEQNGITYRINAGADADLFRINRRGAISFLERPNFETPADADGDNIYQINVLATDSTGLSDSQFIQFEVQDVAGDQPIVTTVAENGTLVSDLPERDSSDRSFVRYSLSGTDAGLFEVAGGTLQFKAAPDFDMPADANGDNVYQFTLTSFNDRDLAYVQTVSVTVEAADSPPPIIISDGGGSTATIQVDEEAIFVTDVEATSAIGDSEGNGLTYSLNAGEDVDLFNIDADTGVITFKAAPDFENPQDDDGNNVYQVNVLLLDSVGNADSQFLSIVVQDLIDSGSAPVITTTATPSVIEGSSLAIDIESTDADGDTEGNGLTYRINAGEDKDLFEIDADTGELFFKTRPDFENPQDDDGNNVYRVNVLVTDSTGLVTSQFIQVSVTDNPDEGMLAFSVVENTTAVSTLPTSDANGPISYSISGGDAAFFEIDIAGALRFISAPDFETPADADGNNVYTFSLMSIDAQNVATVQSVSVTVTNQVSVYLFGGQSNAAGVGSDADDLAGDIANPQSTVQIWEEGRNRFTALRPGFNKNFGNGTGFGSELNFGFLLEQARVNGTSDTEEIYIIKYALGSTDLAVDWNVNGGVNGADNQYDIFTDWVDGALANLTAAGLSYEVEGMTWMQGENDAFVPEYANAYEANLTALIADVRSRYSADLSFVIGQLHDELPNGFQSAAIVRTAQSNVALADPLAYLVDTDDYLVSADSVHFASQGHLDLGRDFAQFFIS